MRLLLTLLVTASLALFAADSKAQAPTSPAPRFPPPRPLVFIPGIAGSQLWIDGRQAWGSIGGLMDLERLRIADGPRSIGPAPTCAPGGDPATCGLLEQIGVLGPIKMGAYIGLMRHLESLGYSRSGARRNLFVFPYDWRQSNFETTEALRDFVQTTPGLANQEFDVLAHSMGGLIALLYATRHDAPQAGETCATSGRCRIRTVITAATPYFGSMNAVATPIEGWGWLSRRLAGGSEVIARTVLSWPSFYELLPTYEGCCGTDASASMGDYNVFSRLPYVAQLSEPTRQAIRSALASRRELDRVVRAGWPPHIASPSAQCSDRRVRSTLYLFIGDRNDTRQSVSQGPSGLEYVERRGDGTVLLRSASMNSPPDAWVSFEEHPVVLDDQNARVKLEHILLRCDISTTDFAAAEPSISVQRAPGGPIDKAVESRSARIVQNEAAGDSRSFSVEASLRIDSLHDVIAPEATLVARLDSREFRRSGIALAREVPDGSYLRYVYRAESLQAPGAGLVEVEVIFAGTVTAQDQAVAY